MGKVRLCFCCAFFLAFFSELGFSETILLKSGQKVEGRVIEDTDKYVKLDFFGVELVYYKDEIDSISRGVQGNAEEVSPQLESLYQAYTSSLNIPLKPKEEKAVEVREPVITQATEATPVSSESKAGRSLSELPPEYQKMIQSVMQGIQNVQASKPGSSNPVGGMSLGMDLSKLPPEYQKILKSTMINMQAAKSGATEEKSN